MSTTTKLLDTLPKHDLYLEDRMPYGYRFEGITVYRVTTKDRQDLDLWAEIDETHNTVGSVDIHTNHVPRILWEIAKHIEGCFPSSSVKLSAS